MAEALQSKLDERVIKVKSSTDSTSLSRSVISAHEKDDGVPITLRAVGAGALNQAVKAAIIANTQLARKGLKIALIPSFIKLEMTPDAAEKGLVTAIQLNVFFARL
jgi:stage V sporulation protein S